jgi:hypothetical protein
MGWGDVRYCFCRGQVHGARKERRITRTRTRIIIIIIRNGAKTISLQTCLGDLIIIRNGGKTISLQTLFVRLNNINWRSALASSLTPLEEAKALRQLIEDFKMTLPWKLRYQNNGVG